MKLGPWFGTVRWLTWGQHLPKQQTGLATHQQLPSICRPSPNPFQFHSKDKDQSAAFYMARSHRMHLHVCREHNSSFHFKSLLSVLLIPHLLYAALLPEAQQIIDMRHTYYQTWILISPLLRSFLAYYSATFASEILDWKIHRGDSTSTSVCSVRQFHRWHRL